MTTVHRFHHALITQFEKIGDPYRAQQQEAYMKHRMPFWGIGAKDVKSITRQICREYPSDSNQEYRDIVEFLFTHGQKREEWYAALNVAMRYKKYIRLENIDLYIRSVRLSQWWDIVDAVASNLVGPALLNHPEPLNSNLLQWIADKDMWIRRTALLTQLKYKDRTNFPLLTTLIKTTADESEFFIRKAIGWALRQYSYTNHEDVLELLDTMGHKLSSLSRKEALKGLIRQGYIK